MEFMRLGPVLGERPAVKADGVIYDLRSITSDIDGSFFESSGIIRTRKALDAGELPLLKGAEEMRVGAPISKPTAVICVGQNYRLHAAESGDEPPKQPIIFLKHPGTIVGPFDNVCIPRGSQKTDWEAELAVVIGSPARYIDNPEQALACVAGYTVANDVSEREFQKNRGGSQWGKGKSCETFLPLGPALIPADAIDPQRLAVRSWVNGEPRQQATTTEMIFSVADLVMDISQYLPLQPGDVILTGTPEGVAMGGKFPFLSEGDVVEIEISGIGKQSQRVIKQSIAS